jgi:glutaminyl-tRNA synthetase
VPCHPRQIEFARLNISHVVTSKRKLRRLVEDRLVSGWDDPRMPTLCGLRRRGYTPEAVHDFLDRIGVAKRNSVVDIALLEHCIREHLNKSASRTMAVLRPLKVVLDNYPPDKVEEMEVPNNPEDPSAGLRKVPFSRELFIEQDDFREAPPPKYYRLSPGKEVRLRSAYLITCKSVVKDPATGEVVEVHCTYDPATRGGSAPDGRKVKSTMHWVSATHCIEAEVRLYDYLFVKDEPDSEPEPSPDEEPAEESAAEDFTTLLNPDSLEVVRGCKLEPAMAAAAPGSRYQFERLGYFCVDSVDSRPGALVMNRTVSLRDTWARIEQKGAPGGK